MHKSRGRGAEQVHVSMIIIHSHVCGHCKDLNEFKNCVKETSVDVYSFATHQKSNWAFPYGEASEPYMVRYMDRNTQRKDHLTFRKHHC